MHTGRTAQFFTKQELGALSSQGTVDPYHLDLALVTVLNKWRKHFKNTTADVHPKPLRFPGDMAAARAYTQILGVEDLSMEDAVYTPGQTTEYHYGVIAAKRREYVAWRDADLTQECVLLPLAGGKPPAAPGDSGSPVVNIRSNLCAMVTGGTDPKNLLAPVAVTPIQLILVHLRKAYGIELELYTEKPELPGKKLPQVVRPLANTPQEPKGPWGTLMGKKGKRGADRGAESTVRRVGSSSSVLAAVRDTFSRQKSSRPQLTAETFKPNESRDAEQEPDDDTITTAPEGYEDPPVGDNKKVTDWRMSPDGEPEFEVQADDGGPRWYTVGELTSAWRGAIHEWLEDLKWGDKVSPTEEKQERMAKSMLELSLEARGM